MKKSIIAYYSKKYIFKELIIGVLYLGFIALSLLGPYLMQYFIDSIIPKRNLQNIIFFALFFLSVYLLMGGIALTIKYFVVNLENAIVTDLRNEMFRKLVHLPLGFYREHKLGSILERLVRDTGVVHSIWGYLFPSIFSSFITFLATLAIIARKSWLMAILALWTIGIYVFIFRYYNEKLRRLYMDTREDADKINSSITDAWNGAKEIKIFQLENLITKRFEELSTVLKKHNCNMEIKSEFSSQLMSLATTLGTLVTLCVGGYLVIQGEFTIGMLVALQTYVAKLYSPAQDIADMAVDYRKYQINIDRMNQILCLESEEISGKLYEKKSRGGIRLEDVSFSYGSHEVLKRLSFELEGKGKVAIAGKSGSGKTTLLNILMGLQKPSSGKVFWGEHRIGESSIEELRSNISLVSQDTYLFHMSVYDNICIGNPEASEDEIQRVIKLMEIDKIVEPFPDKLDTVIAEMGKNISGGQLQRISIARALLKKAPILILDEATSNIDSISEQIIQKALNEIKESTLVIIVSHRLSSLKEVDCIYVLDNGELCQKGGFSELLLEDGVFKSLFCEQIIGDDDC
ncbi:ABC transporter ATP-binding protein [Acetivibrio ethanolgignens]|uniref:ABC transporter ATP-binding protein n=1 Tax=Acetivibrio ethanolgignens TaxID=290052 RepID=A0A0V8QAK4_9FIRM|nr:ABC transporter ATP-binding protein [Acetivibrio ethanolgignens]KSV57438.1 hypothetical protein ASU35_04470 [Acetivibrio ethanolgignens]